MPNRRTFRIAIEDFDLRLTAHSHGWIDLAPFRWHDKPGSLALPLQIDADVVDIEVRATTSGLSGSITSRRAFPDVRLQRVKSLVRSMLRLDEQLDEFHALCADSRSLAWVARRGAGRIFRAPGRFEDLCKLLLTTNCSWAATKGMVQRLVDALGERGPNGTRAFPTAQRCAAEGEDFYREVVRAGYRAPSCLALARLFASGAIDDASLDDASVSTDALRQRLSSMPGFGPYASGQALRLLSRFDDFATDSWCRNRLRQLLGSKQPPSDRQIERRYSRFGRFRGLAMWLELTADWHGE